jgi:hypothetical protein
VTLEWPAAAPLLARFLEGALLGWPLNRVLIPAAAFLMTLALFVHESLEPLPPGWWTAGGLLLLSALSTLLLLAVLRRRVAVVRGAILTGWGPLLPFRRSFPGSAIEQIFVAYREILPVDRAMDTPERPRLLEYDLMAVAPGGRRFPLLRGFTDRQEALFLEGWLERRLGILDRPVEGELLLREGHMLP